MARDNPDEDYDEARRELLELLDSFNRDHRVSIDILQDARPASTPPDHALIRSIQDNVAAANGRHAPRSMCPGCLETRIYSRTGIPAVAYGPGPMSVMHGSDEHVPISNLLEACTVYAAVLGDTLGYRPG